MVETVTALDHLSKDINNKSDFLIENINSNSKNNINNYYSKVTELQELPNIDSTFKINNSSREYNTPYYNLFLGKSKDLNSTTLVCQSNSIVNPNTTIIRKTKDRPMASKLSIENMWDSQIKDNEFAVEGYKVESINFDWRKKAENRKFEKLANEVLNKKAKFTRIRKYDEHGKEILTLKKNFIDEIIHNEIKFNSPTKEKFPELYEKFYPEYKKPTKEELLNSKKNSVGLKSNIYKCDRKTYAELLQHSLKKEYDLNEEKKAIVERVIEKQEKLGPNLSPIEKIMKVYGKKGSLP